MKISQNRKTFKFGKLNLYLVLSFIIFMAALPIKIYAGTDIMDSSSDISIDTTWTVAGSPYYIKNNVIIRNGATLTVEPGVRVKFVGGRELIMVVQGQLIARGTADSMIYFESESSNSAGVWDSIRFETGSVGAVYDDNGNYKSGSIFEYCVIKDSGRGSVKGAIECLKKAVPYINYCELKNNKARSVYFPRAATVILNNNTFSGKINKGGSGGGAYISATTATLANNIFSDNSNNVGVIDSNDGGGGGVFISAATTTLVNNTFSGNSNSDGKGGGACIFATTATLTNNIFSDNSNSGSGKRNSSGGGAYISATTANLTNNTFSSNSCDGQNNFGRGVALFIIANETKVTNCTFKENEIVRNNCVSVFIKYTGRGPSSQLKQCNLLDTKEYQIYNPNSFGTPDVDAENNWWGTSVEAPITDKIYDFFYDSRKGIVNYRPYLKSPVEQISTPGFSLVDKFTKSTNPRIKFETNYGSFTLELNSQKARKTVENFLQYVCDGFYNGTIFHKVIKGLMVQGGGLTADMKKKSVREPIKSEADNGLKNLRGTVAMARLNDPHSATSQFFINVKNNALLDYTKKDAEGWGYCVFGKVVEGMSVLDDIENLPTKTKGGYSDITSPLVVVKRATIVQSTTTQVNTSMPVRTEKQYKPLKHGSSSVFTTNTSNIYHKSNCSKLNTDNLVEFTTTQKARKAGGVPCNHCNP